MFNVGGGEILVILLLALLVLGPDKLPEYARKAGRYMNEFRRLTSGFQEEFRSAMDLSDKDSSSAPAPAASGDALDRATEGPRLVAQPDAPAPTTPSPSPTPTQGDAPVAPVAAGPEAVVAPAPAAVVPPTPPTPPAPVAPPAPAYGGAFAADVTPATAPGPDTATPAGSDHDGGTGSTSAA